MRQLICPLFKLAAFGLAMAFTFSCSSDKDDDNPSGGGNNTNGNSGGGGVPFNENSQIYKHDGAPYDINGIIEVSTYGVHCFGYNKDTEICDWDNIRAGSVNNGIVNLELPTTIPDEYLEDFFDADRQRSCTSYPPNIKSAGGTLVLTNSSKDYIGVLEAFYRDRGEQIAEDVGYEYFSKVGKIACNSRRGDRTVIYNIDAKIGWNKIYCHYTNSTEECSTNNILTKEIKWSLCEGC